ncbi:hypothetical protein IGJ02_002267 [Enterococcus sp. DIV0724b]|uniref:hypothetical protein n=1 Tax=Enterococcus sp. DIV0724b TaxID=2774694 RepID=UPI003D2FA3FC
MKKLLKGIFVCGVLLAVGPLNASAKEQALDYVSIPSYDLRSNVIRNTQNEFPMNTVEQQLYDQYNLLTPNYLLNVKEAIFDGNVTSLEGVQFFKNLEIFGENEGYLGVDPRNLSENTKLKELSVNSTFYSIEFLRELKSLKKINIENNANANYDYHEEKNKSILPIFDLTVLNDLNQLEEVNINTIGYMPAIVQRKEKSTYTIANPVFLSNQFIEEEEDEDGNVIGTKQSPVDFSSINENFSFKEDELTWTNLTPDVKELRFQWSANAEYQGQHFSVRGESIIPVVWK